MNFLYKFRKQLNSKDDIDDSKLIQRRFWNSALIFSIISSLSFAIIYAFLVKIDEVVIAKGKLQALGAEKRIKSNISGIINGIFVEEGQKVKKNQILISIDSEPLKARLTSLLNEKKNLEKSFEIQNEILKRMKEVYNSGAITFIEILKLENSLLEINSDIEKKESEIKIISLEIKDSKIISPVDGDIFNLIPKSEGYFTTAGEELLKVVPEGELEAKVFVNNSDIGFIKDRMKADIRVDAFPFTRFGSISGEIKNIGDEVFPADNLNSQSRFPVYLKIENQFLKHNNEKYYFKPGQSISVNLIVKNRPIITLFTDVFSKSIDSLKSIKSN